MEIRFVSTLTADEEDNLAPALLKAVSTLLDRTALAYTLRIQTSSDKVLHYTRTSAPSDHGRDPVAELAGHVV